MHSSCIHDVRTPHSEAVAAAPGRGRGRVWRLARVFKIILNLFLKISSMTEMSSTSVDGIGPATQGRCGAVFSFGEQGSANGWFKF